MLRTVSDFLKRNMPEAVFEGIGVRPGYSFELGNRQDLHELVGIGQNAVTTRIVETFQSSQANYFKNHQMRWITHK
ncbi:MAG: hypothetical protein EBS81_11040, partial [Gammaproteobacteria bacterium]|nr:hypothetical protein [Gammaproteobacteria bacterium]